MPAWAEVKARLDGIMLIVTSCALITVRRDISACFACFIALLAESVLVEVARVALYAGCRFEAELASSNAGNASALFG